MSRATPDDQLKFLLNCVKHSNNGKIDFVEVASECGIVSKGAAAKRYERLMKANGIHPNGGPSEKCPTPSAPREKSKAAIAKAAAAKRRKIEGDRNDSIKNDDEDDLPLAPKMEAVEQKHSMKQELPTPMPMFSQMPSQIMATQHHLQHPSFPFPGYGWSRPGQPCYNMPPPSPNYVIRNDPSMFDDFCTPELISQHNFSNDLASAEHPRTIPLPPQDVFMAGKPAEEENAAEQRTIQENVILIPD